MRMSAVRVIRGQLQRLDFVLVTLLAVVAAVEFITMPGMFYPGDNFSPRIECANWITTGKLGIDYSHRAELGGFLGNRGQYLYENDAKQKFFSKYGFANTLLYLPPYAWQKWSEGGDLNAQTNPLLFKINVWQVLISMLFAFYLYRLAGLFTSRKSLAFVFVLVSIYSTYAWHYLRSPTLEIFQMAPFVASVYHTLVFMRCNSRPMSEERAGCGVRSASGEDGRCRVRSASGGDSPRNERLGLSIKGKGTPLVERTLHREGDEPSRGSRVEFVSSPIPWLHLALACSWAGLLALTKIFFVVQFIPIWAFAILAVGREIPLLRRPWTNLVANWGKYAVCMALPSVLFIGLLLWSNWYRFGSALDTGYFQWVAADGSNPNRLELSNMPEALRGMFIDRNQYNVFIVYPVFAFALAGMWAFARRHSAEACLLGAVFLVNLVPASMYLTWNGSWCYGPRYQLHILVLGAIPFLEVLTWLRGRIRTMVGASVAMAMAVVLAVSLNMQVQVNSLHYFTYNYLAGFFRQFKIPAMEEQCDAMVNSLHRGITHGDLKAYLAGRRAYGPMEVLKAAVPAAQWPQVKAQVDQHLRQMAKPNYYFFE